MKDGLYWAEKLRKKEVSFQELLTNFEEKARKQNSMLNAFVTMMGNEAREEHQKDTDLLKRPFAGLPIPLKMLGQEKKGWLSTSGSKLLRDHRSSRNSHFTNKLIENGLVPFAQTNTPEFGFKNITDAELYGPARNPWNLDYYSGGSSGGAASAVASGIVPIAGASDGGGSIRIPASFCGLIGLKPTRGTMPVGPSGWRGWIIDSPIHSNVSPEAASAVEKAHNFLLKQGHQIEMISYPIDGKELIASYYMMNGAETAAMFTGIEQGLRRPVERNDMELMTWGIYQYGKKIPASHFIHALNVWDRAAFIMEQLFTEYDLLLTPTVATTAPKINDDLQSSEIRDALETSANLTENELHHLINQMFEKSLEITPYTQLANLTGQPAISLPTYLTEKNLPLGIQFMAARGREDLLLQIGKLFETEYGFCLPEYYLEK